MRITPSISLMFNGDCDAAFALYQQCFGATVTFRMTWGESPMAHTAPPEWHDKVMHATLSIGDAVIYGGDPLTGTYKRPQGFQLQLNLTDVAAAERIYALLAEGGEVTVALQQR